MKKMRLFALLLVAISLFGFMPPEWVTIQSPEGKFRMMFPRQPVLTEDEGDVRSYTFKYDVGKFKDDNITYSISYADHPDTVIHSDYKDAIINAFFDKAIKDALKKEKGTKLSDIKINYKDYPGRRMKMSFMDGKGMVYMQFYLVGSRFYTIQVSCEKEHDNNVAIEKFLGSFTLI
ncbi:hypothetical protein GCM10023093_17200 [Nemorincola caseinilytica]|uniref:Uncharacterized protein n=1 Tax=Nemorincola caseinilytica TaxID=2054315 RepID=A0ABP8NG45_9BACT